MALPPRPSPPQHPQRRPELTGLVGRRVVVRYRTGVRDGRAQLTDTVGELSAAIDGSLFVLTRRGPVRVDPAAVVAAREIPPAPAKRPSWAAVARLENLCADAWPAVVEARLGAWRLRAAGGFALRANTALVTGRPDRPVPEALAAVRAFATRHAIPPQVMVPTGSPWETAVAAAGWRVRTDHPEGAQVAVLVGGLAALAGGDGDRAVVGAEPTPGWWDLVVGGADPTPAQRHVLTAAPAVGFGRCTVDGEAVGAVHACVVEDHLHVAGLVVRQDHRRRGLGRALLTAAGDWAAARGARYCVLQVAVGNAAGMAFSDRLGLTPHHRYHYRIPVA